MEHGPRGPLGRRLERPGARVTRAASPAIVCALALAAAAEADDSRREETLPDLDHFQSRTVEIGNLALSTVTNILPPPELRTASDVQAKIELTLRNRAAREIW